MSNPNLNRAQLSPALIDFNKFNEMLGRRGGGTNNVSIMNPENSPEVRTNPKVQKDREKITEATAGAVGPFTVKIKHEDGYEDEVTSDRHSMAMDKAALTVTDNYASDLTDYKAHTDEQAAKIKKVEEDKTKHFGFEESLRPEVEKILDEHVRTWPDRRAKLIDTINSATGLKLGPLDNIQTRDVHSAFDALRGKLTINGVRHHHDAFEAYQEITGTHPPINGYGSDKKLLLGRNSDGSIWSWGGDSFSGAPDFPEHQIPVGEEEEKKKGIHLVNFWRKETPRLRESWKKWKDTIIKGVRPNDTGISKETAMGYLSTGGGRGSTGFSELLGFKNPHPNSVVPSYSRKTAPKTSTYEMYDSTGKKLHSGTISTDYDTGRDEKGEPIGDVYSTTKRFSARIEPH
jgi:hypothetical protein